MSLSHRYRNFGSGTSKSQNPATGSSDEAMEEQKLQAFEAGYQAGWDDATKAQADEKSKIQAELGQNLLDMSFTYHEALAKVTTSIEPVMQQIVEKLLPETIKAALGAHIVQQIRELVDSNTSQEIEIVVNASNVEAVTELTRGSLKEPFIIVAEETLGGGQAFVRIGNAESQVDLDSVIDGVSKAIEAFFYEAAEESKNG